MRGAAVLALVLALPGCGSGGADPGLAVEGAFVVVLPGDDRGGIYAVIRNGVPGDALLGLEAPGVADRVELHRGLVREGLRIMEPVDSVPIPARGVARLEPGDHHGMLLELSRSLEPGDTVRVGFRFRRAGRRVVDASVLPYAELEDRLGRLGDPDA